MPSVRRGLRIRFLEFVEGDTRSHKITSRGTDNTGSTRIWVIIVSVAGVLALGTCIALVAMSLSRRRLKKQMLQEARQRDPCLGEREFSKKRRMDRDTLEFEAESQRDAMIRKSLATRSGRSISLNSQLTVDMMSADDRPDSRSSVEYRLSGAEDFERRFTRSRSGTGLSDKSWEGGNLMRSKSPFPDRPARTLSRPSSPSRLSQIALGQADLPPLLEQHPLFRNMTLSDDDSDGVSRREMA